MRHMKGRASRAVGTEFLSGVVTGAAALLFVGTGGTAMGGLARDGTPPSPAETSVLLLNIALILFAWFRHRAMRRELTQLAEAGERAETMAAHDPLTGFLNRRALPDRVAALLRQARRNKGAVAAMVLDLDHFKTVNDVHGHAVGDALLREVAGEIRAAVPAHALLARLGGDEFGCFLAFDPADPGAVERVADALARRIGQPFAVEGAQLHVGASVGLARSDRGEETGNAKPGFDALLRAADIAMYAAKNGGRGRVAWFDRSMADELQARCQLERELRAAVPAGQVVPFFEQQVDLVTGRLSGFEVLARWEHPVRGLVLPAQFIAAAETTGIISDLSVAIMRQAFLAARDWDAGLTLSVNVSPQQLKDPWLPEKIIRTLTETGFPANRLEVEITEGALFANLTLAQSIVGSLKNQGVRVALDDFGTGYSSLAHLRALPFDRIKVDRSFVASMGSSPESAAVVNAIVRLGDSLHLPVTAEGIEDAEAEALLRDMGCTRGQGYLYGRPVNAANARRLLAERRLLASPVRAQAAARTRRAG